MPYTIKWHERGTYTKFENKITIEEVNEANNDHYGDARFDDISYQIFDFLDADVSAISLGDTKYPAAYDSAANEYKPKFKAAMIALAEETVALCKAYIDLSKRYNSTWEMAVFSDLEDAKQWCEAN